MNETITNIAGLIPAVVLPIAALSQLITIARKKSADGVSLITWGLFGIANIGLYIYTEKYSAWQSIVGLLGTAVINFIIVTMTVYLRKKAKNKNGKQKSDPKK